MSEAQFTPGPWHLYAEDLRGGRYHCVSFGPQEWDGINLREDENGEANARLIAAAPDLYEALRDCLTLILSRTGSGDDASFAIADRARAALSRAIAAGEGR